MSDLKTNLDKLDGYLARFKKTGILNRIGGKDVAGGNGETFETLSPVDLKPLCDVARGTVEDIDLAAKTAMAAFKDWSAMDAAPRAKILHAIADGIEARAEELAFLECIDTGQSLRFMKKAAIRGAANFRFFADKCLTARDGQTLYAPGQLNVTNRKPLGPVGIITPWNTPFMLSTWKIAPALAAGCTVVHKP